MLLKEYCTVLCHHYDKAVSPACCISGVLLLAYTDNNFGDADAEPLAIGIEVSGSSLSYQSVTL